MRITFPGLMMALLLCGVTPLTGLDEKVTLDDLISRHRSAIGAEEARKAINTRVAEGICRYRILSGGAAYLEGKAALISEKEKVRLLFRFSDANYPGENFVTDGDRIQIYNKPRSGFGELVNNQDAILRDGLLGGVLTAAWPLLSSNLRQAKLSYSGLKKVDDLQLHEVRYTPKKKTDLEIRLYFDPETLRHILTVYTMEVTPKLVSAGPNSETSTIRQQTIRYRLQERFGEFRTVDGVTLPASWTIQLTMEGYQSAVINWEVKFDNLTNNLTLDPRNFPMK
jgi:hypothetical protein